jgi:hypothetical protein
MDEVQNPSNSKFFSLCVIHTGFGVHPASSPMGKWDSFPKGKIYERI